MIIRKAVRVGKGGYRVAERPVVFWKTANADGWKRPWFVVKARGEKGMKIENSVYPEGIQRPQTVLHANVKEVPGADLGEYAAQLPKHIIVAGAW